MEDDDKAKIIALSEQWKATSNSTQSKFSVTVHDVSSMQDIPPDDLEDVLIAMMVTKHPNCAKPPSSNPVDIPSVLSQPAK